MKTEWFLNPKHDALILDLYYGSLSLIRSLGRQGIKVYGVSLLPDAIGGYSRYCTVLNWPDCRAYDETLLSRMMHFGSTKDNLTVLYCLSDEAVEFVNEHRDTLKEHYLFQLADPYVMRQILSKTKLAELLDDIGIPHPRSMTLNDSNIDKVAEEFHYPFLMKLAHQKSWKCNPKLARDFFKVKVIENASDLRYWFTRLKNYDEILAQDLVPGESETLYYAAIYCSGIPGETVVFIGQKIRIAANGYGSETFYRSVENEEIKKICMEFLSKTNYVGFAGMDFKFDKRDNKYKLIEINGRFGLSDGIAIACGIDLPYFYYQHLTGRRLTVPSKYTLNKHWIWLKADFETYLGNHRQWSFFSWLFSIIKNDKCYLVYDSHDLRPFFQESFWFLRKLCSYIIKRIKVFKN